MSTPPIVFWRCRKVIGGHLAAHEFVLVEVADGDLEQLHLVLQLGEEFGAHAGLDHGIIPAGDRHHLGLDAPAFEQQELFAQAVVETFETVADADRPSHRVNT